MDARVLSQYHGRYLKVVMQSGDSTRGVLRVEEKDDVSTFMVIHKKDMCHVISPDHVMYVLVDIDATDAEVEILDPKGRGAWSIY